MAPAAANPAHDSIVEGVANKQSVCRIINMIPSH